MTRFAMVQAPACREVGENLRTLEAFARQAAVEGCAAICFPEAFLTGYFPEVAARLAIGAGDAALDRTAAVAAEVGIDLLVGFMERREGQFFLTHGIFRPDGSRDFYRKTHLGQKERRFFTPGNVLPVFSLSGGWRVGFQLCVETHFPEITQTLSLRGAELIFAPHAVPRRAGDRLAVWGKYIPARSYDSRVYLACCNLWDGDRFGGGCLVTGPEGEVLARCGENAPALLTFQASRASLEPYHAPESPRTRYFPGQRRPELYE